MMAYFIKKRKITIFFFTMVIWLGLFNFFKMAKQESPDIKLNIATVTTIYPGASPEKIEQTVTKKIEEKIKEIQGIKSITSSSRSQVSAIVVETKEGVDVNETWNELRKKVKDAETELPTDAKAPRVNDDLNRSFVQTINISAESKERLYALRDTMKVWKEELRAVPNVSDVVVEGLPEQELRVEADIQKLAQYGIVWQQVLAAVQAGNEKVPLGDFEVTDRVYQLRMQEERNPERLNNLLVATSKQGVPIYLRDIATVRLSSAKEEYLAYHNGRPSLSLSMDAEKGSDIPSLQKRLDEKVLELKKNLPVWAQVDSLYSQNERIDKIFGDLTRETLVAILAVLLVCSLGLNFITSFVIALAIPISIAMGLLVAPYFNITLNMITIVALIIVLGILVDDAVVVNDNIERHLSELGKSPREAVIQGPKEVFYSILSATLATICSFGPLAFLSGNAGAFIFPIPVIISFAMLASMIMSFTIIPIFRQWHEERSKKSPQDYRKPAGLLGKQLEQLTDWYAHALMPKIIEKPKQSALIGIGISFLAYMLTLITPVELFPPADRPEMLVNIKVTQGSGLGETDRVVRSVADWVSKQAGVTLVAGYVGGSAPKMFGAEAAAGLEGIESGQVVVKINQALTSTDKAVKGWTQPLQAMHPEAHIVPKELDAGPPVGKPIVIRMYGTEVEGLAKLAQEVKEKVSRIQGSDNLSDDIGLQRHSIEFEVNKDVMDKKQVNERDLSSTLRLVSEGLFVSQFDNGKELIDMILYAKQREVDPMGVFQNLTVPNAMGEQIPLLELAQIKPAFQVKQIPHRNLSRVVTVSGDVVGRTATEVMQEIQPILEGMAFPEGYRWEIGGETSEQTEIFVDMGKLMVVVLMLIIVIIAMQFDSFVYPFMILITVFLAFAGSIIGLFVTQNPLGFMAMMGAIALIGIVVRNGIVLIEFIENERHNGVELGKAAIRAGEARLRPVLLTAATAISGLLPLALSKDVLFAPLAITIIFGLLFSTILTLVMVPALYIIQANFRSQRMAKNGGLE